MSLIDRAAKAPNYVRRFGLVHGLYLLQRVERSFTEKSESIRRFDVPPIHLRDSTSDHAIFWQCLVKCHYDFFSFPQSRRLLEAYEGADSPLIIDCGANIGLASVWFASRFPKAQIYAIEPDPDNFRLLKRNCEAFGRRITPVHGGIWHERAELTILNPRSGSAAYRTDAHIGGGKIAAYTIADICSMAGVAAPLIVKIDIEGAQAKLFSANTGWVGQTHLITLELDDWLMPWQGTSRRFFSCVSQYAFDYLLHGESVFCFRDFLADDGLPLEAHSAAVEVADAGKS